MAEITVAPTTATSTAGSRRVTWKEEEHEQHSDADEQRARPFLRLIEPLEELADVAEERVRVGRESEELREAVRR